MSSALPPDDPAPGRRSRWPWIVLASVVLAPALLLAIWTAVTLAYTYSSGERAGYVQKFSKKGWICKTWEGELAMVNVPGALQERFAFTVRDDSVAAQINELQGRRVAISYEQHRAVPLSCIGETEYFVHAVRPLEGPPGSWEQAPGDTAIGGVPVVPRRDTIDPSTGTP